MDTIKFSLNGEPVELSVKPGMTLLQLLRRELNLTGTKEGCGKGECGACTVIINGEAVTACLIPVEKVSGKKVETIESLGTPEKLHPIQRSFVEAGAIQCGFCTPGMVMSAKALLDETKEPSIKQINEAVSGNLCRCTGYVKIRKAVQAASAELKK